MALIEMAVASNVEKFLSSSGFESLLFAMKAINSSTDTETADTIAKLAARTFVVNWAQSGEDGSTFSVVDYNDLRFDDDGAILKRERGFPQINTQNGREVMQLTFSAGEKSIDEFKFPTAAVVEQSSRVLAARLEKMSGKYESMHTTYYDSIFIATQRGGGIALSEKPYRGNWQYNKRASDALAKHVNTNDLYQALARVS